MAKAKSGKPSLDCAEVKDCHKVLTRYKPLAVLNLNSRLYVIVINYKKKFAKKVGLKIVYSCTNGANWLMPHWVDFCWLAGWLAG